MSALRLLLLVVLPAFVAACGGGLAPGTYVVVSHAATFRASASPGGIGFRAQTDPPLADAAEDAAGGVVLRVRSMRDGWAEVENPTSDEIAGHCRVALDEIDAFRLHFYVPAAALDPVVARPVRETYPDGTRIDLLPGLPLGGPDAAGRQTAWRDGMTLRLALPADAVGKGYAAPAPATIAEFAKPPEELPEDAPTLVNDAHLTVGPHAVEIHQAQSVRPRPTEKGLLIDLVDPCARLVALAKPDDVGTFGYGGPGGRSSHGAGGHVTDTDTRYLHPGTALFWADGTPAGEAREEREYDLWHHHPTRKDLVCIVHDLTNPGDTFGPNEPPERAPPHPPKPTELTLCFRYADSNFRPSGGAP